MNRRNTSVAANPVLIGAATVLVVIVAVFLAYNANNGLPFVPTYQLWLQLPDASNLVTGNEVRIGGDRVGIIDKIEPQTHRDGSVTARAAREARDGRQAAAGRLDDHRAPALAARPQVRRGDARQLLERDPRGRRRCRSDNATPRPVEFDDFFNMFDEPTRAANQVEPARVRRRARRPRHEHQRGDRRARPAARRTRSRCCKNLADPNTALGRLFRALEQTAAAVAPVGAAAGPLFRNLAITFDAFATSPTRTCRTRSAAARPALDTAIRSFPIQRPLLANTAGFFRDLQPGAAALRTSAPLLADGVRGRHDAGASRRARSTTSSALTLRSLQDFAQDPQVPLGIHGLRRTVEELTPTVNHLAGAQINCNYLALLLQQRREHRERRRRRRPGHVDARLPGRRRRSAPNSEVGPGVRGRQRAADDRRAQRRNHLHANPYPLVGAKGQNGICMAGNESYVPGQTVIGNPPGQAPRATSESAREAERLDAMSDSRRPHAGKPRAGRASASACSRSSLISIGVYFGFTKDIPFTHGY